LCDADTTIFSLVDRLFPHLFRVDTEDHVQVRIDDDDDFRASRIVDRDRSRAKIVVHPVGEAVAVTDRDAPVVPFRYEDAGIVRVRAVGKPGIEIIVAAVYQRQHRAGGRTDQHIARSGRRFLR
jgi:hypothetical protein